MRYVWFTLWLVCWSNMLIAQQSYYYKIDSENGFQSNEVYEIAQDSFGFIWIGCDAGVFRYDGVNFKQYIHSEQNGRSISHLIIDKQQRVWCQNFSGQIFYIHQDSIHLFKDFSKENASFPSYTVTDNQLIASLSDSTKVYDTTQKQQLRAFRNFTIKDGKSLRVIHLYANSSTLYLNSRNNIYYIRKGNEIKSIYEREQYYCPRISIIDDKLYALLFDAIAEKWLVVEGEQEKMKIIKEFPADYFPEDVYMISKIKDGFAICTAKGAYLFDKNFNRTRYYFPNEKITDALYDREGNLWLTSLQNGIYVIPSIDLKVYDNQFFPYANVTTLAVQKSDLLIGTYSGVFYNFNPETEIYKRLPIEQNSRFNTVKRIKENEQYQVFAQGSKTKLINKKTKKQTILKSGNIRDFVLWKDSIYSVDRNGVHKTNLKYKRSEKIFSGSGRMIKKSPNSDTIYFSTKNGFYYYINGQIEEIRKSGQAIYPVSADWQGDTLWLGTLHDGFMAYKNGQFFNHFYKNEGGYGNMVRSICSYKNWLLAATDLGLIRLDLTTQKIEIINRSDGLHQNEIMRIEVINDDIFLATTVGLIRFPLSLNAQNQVIPNIKLNSLVVNDSITFDLTKNNFRYNENNILFQFETALFRSRKGFYYEYRLKGLNDNWQKTEGTAPFAQYRSLPSGRYIFEVRAVNEDEMKSSIEQFSFSVAAPIWLRWWFISLFLLFIATMIYFFVNRRIRRIKQQARIENELKTSQLTALKAQMNPHFLYNALNSIQDFILQKDVRNATRYLTKFSHLMRQVLDASGMTAITLSDEIKILTLYLDLEKLRFGDDFQYEIHVNSEIDEEFLQIPSMIIQPFIENAVKHGLLHKTKGIKQLNIDFKKEDLLICTVTDNGVGRAKSTQIQVRQGRNRTSFATSATQKRLDILNETYQQKIGLKIIDLVENNEAKGTKVILRVPYKNHS